MKRFLLISYLVAAMASMQAWADLQYGVRAMDASNYATALKELTPIAEGGDATAQFSLGKMYLYGWGVKKNEVEAAKWFHKAAEQGNAKAQKMLAYMYERGVGVEKNPAEAEKWNRKAAISERDIAISNVETDMQNSGVVLQPSGKVVIAGTSRCEQLGQQVSVRVIYTDVVVSEDYSHTVAFLKAMSVKALDKEHSIYGLTHAQPTLNYEFKATLLTTPENKICTVPDITLKVGFSVMQVYVAKELQDDCRKQIIREHEFEHVNTWKTQLRAGSRLMEKSLRQAFAHPRYYDSISQAEQELRPWVEGVVKPLERRLFESANSAQSAIDSPLSYSNVESRLRTCPP